MSILHLLWIIPLAGSIGFITAAVLAANGRTAKSRSPFLCNHRMRR